MTNRSADSALDWFELFVHRITPNQLGPLPFGQTHMGVGEVIKDVGSRVVPQFGSILTDQPVPEANEVVPNIDRGGNAVFLVQRLVAVAELVGVFDIVMNERCLVKRLNRHGGS